MPRKRRKENMGLPARWRFTRNAYYYQVPPGLESAWDGKKTYKLGKTLAEAHKEFAKRIDHREDIHTIPQLLERYMREVVPNKAPRTQTSNAKHIKRLSAVFDKMRIHDIRPKDIYKYYDTRTSKTDARQEVAVLRHAYTKAVEWGIIDRHPFKGEVRIKGAASRTRYVADDEVLAALALPLSRQGDHTRMVQAYIQLKLLTGMRQRDLLLLNEQSLTEEGIRVTPSKTANSTGREVIYQWSDELRQAVALAKEARPVDISPFLFCDREGKGFVNTTTGRADAWGRLWQRFMNRLRKATGKPMKFTEHDLRAKAGSDAESDERARQLLSHTSVNITRRVYRRKPEVVKPLR